MSRRCFARDIRLGRQVVIKENLPVQFCFRDTHSLTVAPRHTIGEDVENFRWSLDNFSKEAAMLASLDHPGIVKVLRSFEAFGTAYFVMPFIDGVAFDELIESRKTKRQTFAEDELQGFLGRLLDALDYQSFIARQAWRWIIRWSVPPVLRRRVGDNALMTMRGMHESGIPHPNGYIKIRGVCDAMRQALKG
jgi:serine/threonine protein kinase